MDLQKLYREETHKPAFECRNNYTQEYVEWLQARCVFVQVVKNKAESAPMIAPMDQPFSGPYSDKLNELIAAFNAHVTGERIEGSSGPVEWYYPKDGEVIRKGDEVKGFVNDCAVWSIATLSVGALVGNRYKQGEVRRRR